MFGAFKKSETDPQQEEMFGAFKKPETDPQQEETFGAFKKPETDWELRTAPIVAPLVSTLDVCVHTD
jgi:hypothetical protein